VSPSRSNETRKLTVAGMDRYLHLDNIDMRKPDVSSQCSRCGQRFEAEPKPGERVDDVLLRIRAHFDSHLCYKRLM
jgi:hypothetical protein